MDTSTSTPRILLIGDYSNCHRTLATGLRNLGCEVTQMSSGTKWMQTERQIDISRAPGRLGGLRHFVRFRWGDISRIIRGYDIVAVHDPHFTELHPHRLRPLYDRLRRDNGRVFLTAMSTDIPFLDMLSAPDSPLRYSEWFVDGQPSRMYLADPAEWDRWHSRAITDYQRHFFDTVDGAVSVLYEYQLGMERALGTDRTAYGGIPVDTSLFTPVTLPEKPEKVKLFLGRDRTRKLMKGSDLLEEAALAAMERHPGRAELQIVENVSFARFTELLRGAHVVLDQIYSYTPATTALMAMACGLNTVSGAEPEYYRFINEAECRPIINAPITLPELTDTLGEIITHPELIAPRGRESRKFVERHNDATVVARRFLDFWLSKL